MSMLFSRTVRYYTECYSLQESVISLKGIDSTTNESNNTDLCILIITLDFMSSRIVRESSLSKVVANLLRSTSSIDQYLLTSDIFLQHRCNSHSPERTHSKGFFHRQGSYLLCVLSIPLFRYSLLDSST